MYQHTTPGSIGNMITDIESFLNSAGFAASISTGTKNYNGDYSLAAVGNSALVHMNNPLANTPAPAAQAYPVTTINVQEPNSTQTISLLFYTLGGMRNRRSTNEETYYMDYRMNDKKIGLLYNLPASIESLDLLAGTNPDGTIWAHAAIEEKPYVYMHFGLGTIQKFLPFTGGEYVTAHFIPSITVNNIGNICAYGANNGNINAYFICTAYYAPDLDAANKSSGNYDYRTLSGNTGTILTAGYEPGRSSLRFSYGISANIAPLIAFHTQQGGELCSHNFPLPNSWSGNSPLLPIMVYASNYNDLNMSGACGFFKGVRTLDIANYQPRDEIVLGSDIWVVYPIIAKRGVVADSHFTHNQGYAVLKNG